jgi:hypothetical protein
MTPDEESSDGSSIIKIELELSTAVEQFHARKFGGRAYNKAEKMSALKMSNAGRVKKQKTLVKMAMQEVVKMLGVDGLELMCKEDEQDQLVKEEKLSEDGASLQGAPNLTCTRGEAR